MAKHQARARRAHEQRGLMFSYTVLLNMLGRGLAEPYAYRDVVYTLLRAVRRADEPICQAAVAVLEAVCAFGLGQCMDQVAAALADIVNALVALGHMTGPVRVLASLCMPGLHEWTGAYRHAVAQLDPLPTGPGFDDINHHCASLRGDVDLDQLMHAFVANARHSLRAPRVSALLYLRDQLRERKHDLAAIIDQVCVAPRSPLPSLSPFSPSL